MNFTWTPNNNALSVSQELQWKDDSIGVWNISNVVPANPLPANASSAQITGLLAGRTYSIRVKMNCTGGGFTYSAVMPVNTGFACIGPQDFGATTSTQTAIALALPNSYNRPIAAAYTKIKARLYKQSDDSFVEQVDKAITDHAVAQVFNFGSGVPLVAATGYYFTYQLCKDFGGQELCSPQDNCGGNVSDYKVQTQAAGINVVYGWGASDPYVDDVTIPAIANPSSQVIAHNAPISLSLGSVFVGKFFVLKEPVSEPVKVFYDNGFSPQPVGDAVIRLPFIVSGFRYYVSRDPAGFAFTYTNPLIFS